MGAGFLHNPESLFSWPGEPNNPNGSPALCETYYQEPIFPRMADDDFTLLLFRVGLIIENGRQRVSKHGGCFLESHFVFLGIGIGLILVPLNLKAHGASHPGKGQLAGPFYACLAAPATKP